MVSKMTRQEVEQALACCNTGAIRTPGSIQSCSALIAVCPDTLQVQYASENTQDFLGIAYSNLLGKPLSDIFDQEVKHQLTNALRTGVPEGQMIEIGEIDCAGHHVWASACAAHGHGIFQFEQPDLAKDQNKHAFRDLSYLSSKLDAINDMDTLLTTAARMMRALTGYNRVVVYKFLNDGEGCVVAEDVVSDLEPWLGLHFPKWDIPDEARAIMAKTPMRYIEDVNADQVPLYKVNETLPDLDLTAATARSSTPIHLTYISNMKHRSAFTLNIVQNESVWGFVSFFHDVPKKPTQSQRQISVQLTKLITAKIAYFQAHELLKFQQSANDIRKRVGKAIDENGTSEDFEITLLTEVSNAIGADGAAIIFNERLITIGNTPSTTNLHKLLNRSMWTNEIYASQMLAEDSPKLAKICGPMFPGLLVVPSSDFANLAFFRHATSQTVSWAGVPDKIVTYNNGVPELKARESFAVHKRVVEGKSTPWDSDALRLAADLWALLVSAERHSIIKKTNRQQKLLINELNHRVRNILALIRALSRETLTHNATAKLEGSMVDVKGQATVNVTSTGMTKVAGSLLKLN